MFAMAVETVVPREAYVQFAGRFGVSGWASLA